ncbi:MAG: hypothetical protein R2753_14110 [Chitinophagales bacterium]
MLSLIKRILRKGRAGILYLCSNRAKASTVAQITKNTGRRGAMPYTVIVAANAS